MQSSQLTVACAFGRVLFQHTFTIVGKRRDRDKTALVIIVFGLLSLQRVYKDADAIEIINKAVEILVYILLGTVEVS